MAEIDSCEELQLGDPRLHPAYYSCPSDRANDPDEAALSTLDNWELHRHPNVLLHSVVECEHVLFSDLENPLISAPWFCVIVKSWKKCLI